MTKFVNNSVFSGTVVLPDCEKISSFNSSSTFCKDTKLLIVGTITPPKAPYFYCSKHNSIYGYIDQALIGLGKEKAEELKNLKAELNSAIEEENKCISKIKDILDKNHIAF